MIFYMGSKTFQNEFLMNESDDDILRAQYIIVSQRIMQHSDAHKRWNNIVVANSVFWPSANVLSAYEESDQHAKYLKQLDKNKVYMASVLSTVLEQGYHVIFLCSENEMKVGHLKYIAEYYYDKFKYPVYDYHSYCLDVDELIPYDKKKVLKRCKKIRETAKDDVLTKLVYDTDIHSEDDERKVVRELKKYSKSELRSIVKKMDFYEDGMSKSDMIDTIITFM